MSKTPPIPGGVKHKKTLDTDSVHIQRSEAQHRTYCGIPLYKKQNRRYNKNRNVPIIRLRMELILRMQEAGARNTCFCIALFVPYKGNYTAFWKIVKGHLSVLGKNRAYQNDLAPAKPVPFWCSGWLHRIANDVSSEYNRFRIITVGS